MPRIRVASNISIIKRFVIRGTANIDVNIDYAASTDVTDARQMRPIIARQLKQTIFRACEYANECTVDLMEYRLRLWIIGVGISGVEPGKDAGRG